MGGLKKKKEHVLLFHQQRAYRPTRLS